MHKFFNIPSILGLGTYVRGKAIYMNTKQKIRHGIFFPANPCMEYSTSMSILHLECRPQPTLDIKLFLCKLQDKLETWTWANCATRCSVFTFSLASFGQTSWIWSPFSKGHAYHHGRSQYVVDHSWPCVEQRGQDDFQRCLMTSAILRFLEAGICE